MQLSGDEPELEAPARRTPLRRLPLGRAIAALLVAFVAAQLLGKLAADLARSLSGVARDDSLSAPVIVPSMLASELTLLGVALLAPLLSRLKLREALGLHPAPLRVFFAAALGTVMLGPLGDKLMSLFSSLFPDWTLGVVPALHELAQRLPVALLWPTFALLPGLSEELLFRGVLQRSLVRPALAIAVSGSAFALFHVDPVHVLGVLPLGLFLAWTAQRCGTLVTVVAHVLNNSVALLTIRTSELDVGFGTEHELPLSYLIASLTLVAAAMTIIARAPAPLQAAGETAG